jgi:hypothetical protein
MLTIPLLLFTIAILMLNSGYRYNRHRRRR